MQLIYKIEEALEWFERKKIIIFPTETVYGLGARALCDKEIEEIFKIKNRPLSNPLIIHFNSIEQIEKYCYITETERIILQRLSPGPVTLLLKKKDKSSFRLATNNSEYICARIPQGKFAYGLIDRFGPIAAPSANLSGQLTLTSQVMIKDSYECFDIGCYIDDELIGGVESTILRVIEHTHEIVILRKGFIDEIMLKQFGNISYDTYGNDNYKDKTVIPGTKFLHYQIHKPLIVCDHKSLDCFHIGIGEVDCDFNLSISMDIEEIKKNYFYSLFLGDRSVCQKVSICPFPNKPEFYSLQDRLEKTLQRH